MNYYESPKRKKRGDTGLYILIACGLIAVGVLTWFAVSRNSNKIMDKNPPLSQSSEDKMSYPDMNSSYNESVNTPSKDNASGVNKPVSDVPYSSEKTESTKDKEPVQAPIMPVEGKILKDFNDAVLQYSATFGDMRLHTGVDIEAKPGTTVKAAAAGIVTATDESASLGKTVTIDHSNGIIIKYCGLDNVTVAVGKKVKMGDPIAVVGSIPAECADKSHLHIEATKDGKVISPLEIIGKLPK